MTSGTMTAILADVSAECAILSAAAQREEWLLDILQEVSVEDFSRDETRAMFSVISRMYERGENVSVETIALHGKELTDAGYIAGRDLTLTAMIGNPPIAHEIPGYVSTVKEMTARRKVLQAASLAVNMINRGEMADTAYGELERLVMARTSTGMTRENLSPSDMGAAIESAVDERMDKDALEKAVVYSTFGALNRACGGFEKGDLVILSAESGAGKSAFSMNLANSIAITNKRPCLYLNSEMQTKQLALRWASHLAGVSHSALRNGNATPEQAAAARGTGEVMRRSALWTLNMPDMQIPSVLAEVRRAKAQHNIEIAFVDYLGRMDTMNLQDAKEWQVMKSAAQRLKTLAVELQITVVMVAQLTSDGGRLAQSSYMSHEADLWLNIGKIAKDDLLRYWPWNYVLTFRKARNVESDKKVMFRFNGDTLTFTDLKSKAEELAGKKPLLAGAVTTKGRKAGVPF